MATVRLRYGYDMTTLRKLFFGVYRSNNRNVFYCNNRNALFQYRPMVLAYYIGIRESLMKFLVVI